MRRVLVMTALLFSASSMLMMVVFSVFLTLIFSFQPLAFVFYLIFITFLVGIPALASLRMPAAGGILQIIIGFAIGYSFLSLAQTAIYRNVGFVCGGLLAASGLLFLLSTFLEKEQA